MAIGTPLTNLVTPFGATGTTATSGAATPTAGALLLFWTEGHAGTTTIPTAPDNTADGGGWTLAWAGVVQGSIAACLWAQRVGSSPVSTTFKINSTGNAHVAGAVVQITGSGDDFTNLQFAQNASAANPNLSVTLPALAGAGSGVIYFGAGNAGAGWSVPSGYTEVTDSAPATNTRVVWGYDLTSPGLTLVPSATATHSIHLALELKEPADGPITGVLAKTEGIDTLASAGKVRIAGTLAKTEASDTLVAAGTKQIIGSLSKTESNDTLSATATLRIVGTLSKSESSDTLIGAGIIGTHGALAVTEANDTLVATGKARITGVAAKTEAADTLAGVGKVRITSVLAKTEGDDTLVATATLRIAGTLSKAEGSDTLVAEGAGITPPDTIIGILAVTEANDTLIATGKARIASTLAVTEALDTVIASGVIGTHGTLSATEANDTLVAVASLRIAGVLSKAEAPDTVVAEADLLITGAFAKTESDDTVAGTSILQPLPITGTLSATEADDTLSSFGGTPADLTEIRVAKMPHVSSIARSPRASNTARVPRREPYIAYSQPG
jgi:hypothetical protein